LRSNPTAHNMVTSDDPPRLMKGRVTPVIGMSSALPPAMTNVWMPIQAAIPPAASEPKADSDRCAIRMARATRAAISNSKPRVPTKPNSSAMAA